MDFIFYRPPQNTSDLHTFPIISSSSIIITPSLPPIRILQRTFKGNFEALPHTLSPTPTRPLPPLPFSRIFPLIPRTIADRFE